MKKVMIVAAHPDDEILGIGGIVALHTRAGDEVYSVIMCEGESLRYQENVGQNIAMENAREILGVKKVYSLGFPDQRLDTFSLVELITPLEKLADEIRPNIIYCQNCDDINRDHQILFEAANVAFRPLNEWIEEFYTFYTASSTEWAYPRAFIPDTWVDISDVIDLKLDALSQYKSEMRNYPHPRSVDNIKHTAMFFGSQCCMEYAEPLRTIRRTLRKN